MTPAPKGIFGRAADLMTDRVLDTVDPDLILDHVDVNKLLDRIDVDRLLARIDVDALMSRVDVDALMARVDVEGLVARSGIPDIVAESTSHLAGNAIDLGRRQVVGLDVMASRLVGRVLRRTPSDLPNAPGLLIGADVSSVGLAERRTNVTGQYAGPVGRLAAWGIDGLLIAASFTATVAILHWVLGSVFGVEFSSQGWWWTVVGYAAWYFIYVFTCLVVAGRTPGKAVVGLRVVRASGAPLTPRPAFVRTLVWPISVGLWGIGLIPLVLRRNHRAAHDSAGGTAVVYDFGDRPAELPGPLSDFLNRHNAA